MSLPLVRTFSASFGLLDGLRYGLFAIYTPKGAKRQVKANFLGVMRISLSGEILTRDGYLISERTLKKEKGGDARVC